MDFPKGIAGATLTQPPSTATIRERCNDLPAKTWVLFRTNSVSDICGGHTRNLQIVFSERHVKGAKLKFDSDEFGRVQAEKILSLSNIPLLVVDILTRRREIDFVLMKKKTKSDGMEEAKETP